MNGEKESTLDKVITWASGQPFNNVLLMAILISIGWGMHYSVTIAVPKHLEQIQRGYEKIDGNQRDERQAIRDVYDKWIQHVVNTRSKTLYETAEK